MKSRLVGDWRLSDLIQLISFFICRFTGDLFFILKSTLHPDMITIYKKNGSTIFLIFDAKYYLITLGHGKLAGNPGLESITKQYLYELAYKQFLEDNQIETVKNCFLFPMEDESIPVINIGFVKMDMFDFFNLEKIQLLKLSASRLYEYYLHNKKMDLSKLPIYD